MSKIYFLFIIFHSLSLLASDDSAFFPDVNFDFAKANNSLTAMNYIPAYKDFAIRLRVQGHTETLNWDENVGDKRIREGSGMGLKLMYGLFRHTSFYFESDYASVDKFSYTQNGGTFQNKEKGTKEGTIGFLWRAMYQDRDPFSLDFDFGFSPSAGKAKRAGVGGNGNRLRGGKETDFQIIVTRQFPYIEYQGFYKLKSYGEYQEANSFNSLQDYGSYTVREYGAAIQYEGLENAFMQLGMRKISVGEGAFRANHTYKDRLTRATAFKLKFGSMIDKNKTLLSVILDYKFGKSVLVNNAGTNYNAQYKDLEIILELLFGNF